MRASVTVSGSPEVRKSGVAESLGIVGLCIGMAIGYGVLHDLVTAHVCVEYFTIGHDNLFGTENPILLALGWGIVATWYVGAVLSIPLVCAARLGPAVQHSARDLVNPMLVLFAIMAVCALNAGALGHVLGSIKGLSGALGDLVPEDAHARFIAVAYAHGASYGVGFIGGLVLPVFVWVRRQRQSSVSVSR